MTDFTPADLFDFTSTINASGTSLQGEATPADLGCASFEELVAKLATLTGQDPAALADGYKTSVEFVGTFRGAVFTLYDWKGERGGLHIGGHPEFPVEECQRTLRAALAVVEPTPYRASADYDGGLIAHSWPVGR